ncbi:hypothetical protein [Paenibacillus thiaminolyticus]|uniref:hypothetical protein n=1 Tax=Paenibacillus thiaminolyticus TaxID=49283 RepID=UPI002542DEFF|nr:hypothetical protein [Paenibacillus thiaminolyticus]WII39510.1 hypothetical protein O0V01_10630 [Paenibacillus thiaminolyticus]
MMFEMMEPFIKLREVTFRQRHEEREKFYELFNIIHHEASIIDPLLGEAILELEIIMDDLFYNESFDYVIGFVDGVSSKKLLK